MVDIEKLRNAVDIRQQVMIIVIHEMQSKWFTIREVHKCLQGYGIPSEYYQVEHALRKMAQRQRVTTILKFHQKWHPRMYKQAKRLQQDYNVLYPQG